MRIVFWDCLVASEFAGVLYLLQHQSDHNGTYRQSSLPGCETIIYSLTWTHGAVTVSYSICRLCIIQERYQSCDKLLGRVATQ